jgi:hypothetical protein
VFVNDAAPGRDSEVVAAASAWGLVAGAGSEHRNRCVSAWAAWYRTSKLAAANWFANESVVEKTLDCRNTARATGGGRMSWTASVSVRVGVAVGMQEGDGIDSDQTM